MKGLSLSSRASEGSSHLAKVDVAGSTPVSRSNQEERRERPHSAASSFSNTCIDERLALDSLLFASLRDNSRANSRTISKPAAQVGNPLHLEGDSRCAAALLGARSNEERLPLQAAERKVTVMGKKTKAKRSAEFYGSKTTTGGQAAPEDQDKSRC
jgi:hypothetical protein